MSYSKPSYDDEDFKGSVDFDFFTDGPESSRKTENDAQPSARSSGSHRSSNLSKSKAKTSPTRVARQSQSANSSGGSSPGSSPDRKQQRPRSRSASPEVSDRSRGKDIASVSSSDSEREAKTGADPVAKRHRSRDSSASRSSRSRSSSGSKKSRSRSSSASDVTDVSPLSSPRGGGSPRAAAAAAARTSADKPPRAGGAEASQMNAEERDEDRINMETIVRALVELDKRRCQSAGPQRPGLHSGTQSMSRIHDIEAENQRLLYNLMRTKNRSKKPSNIDPPVKRPHHSTVNRQKEQRRIEEENRKIFQRLKQVRPTRGMSRSEMITDYKRQASFGLPLSLLGEDVKYRQPRITQNPYCQPVSRVHSSSSLVHQGGGGAPVAAGGRGSGASVSSRPGSAASRASGTSVSAKDARGSRNRGGAGGAGASSGRPGWPAGW